MLKKLFCVFTLLIMPCLLLTEYSIKKIDLLSGSGFQINAAGPLLIKTDSLRNRVILANTNTSSITVINGNDHSVLNIPIGSRVPQYLKADAMTIDRKTGEIYLIGYHSFHIVSPDQATAKTIATDRQFEMIAVDENTGNVFLVGREDGRLGFYLAKSQRLTYQNWLEKEEKLINLNQTPPPSIRKIVVDNSLKTAVAVDGFTSTLWLFNAATGKPLRHRSLSLTSGGRWHWAGYNEATHHLYVVVETKERRVIQAAKISVTGAEDMTVPLPQLTEGVGIVYNPQFDEIYIPYDNHPTVHLVDFKQRGQVTEIKVPTFGNDGSAIDGKNDILYIASWAAGEVDVIDLKSREFRKRITNLGIIPHMFSLAFNGNNNLLYIPKGATAVNGSFGSAVTVLDPASEKTFKIHAGWAPVDLIEMKDRNSFLVFNSEDQFAEVCYDGSYLFHPLPYDYPLQAVHSLSGDVYLSYGPHQSYWPVVYIWGAKNGILKIDDQDLSFYDRRIPRQALRIVLDKDGVLHMLQNPWGREPQFLGKMEDEIRLFEIGNRIVLSDTVDRETTQRILQYDPELHRLYVARVGEKDEDPGVLQIVDLASNQVINRTLVGITPTDLVFDQRNLYVANFESNNITVIDKLSFVRKEVPTGEQPLKLCARGDDAYVINHRGNSLQEVKGNGAIYAIPFTCLPDNLFAWGKKLVVTAHNPHALYILLFDPETKAFKLLHQEDYPFGDTRFDTGNSSFNVRGQYADALFSITQAKADQFGRLWMTDFLSGKLFILEEK